MSSEVRLACAGDAETFVASSSGTWIALPAAEFEAWRRVVGAARELDGCYDIMPGLAALRKALRSMHSNQPPGPAGAKEGE